MSIIRSPRPESNFYILDKRISEDERLTWAARGLLVFLLGKPDHWRVNIQALVNATGEACRPIGKTAVYAIIAELLKVGYMTRQKHGDGTLDYYVHEVPQTPVDKGGEPDSGNPDLENPDLGFQPLVSTEEKQALKNAARTDLAASRPAKKSSDRGTKLPADFVVQDCMREWAKENRLASPDSLVDAFKDYHTARGSVMKDWEAAFRTWIRNDAKFRTNRSDTVVASKRDTKSLDSMDYSKGFFD